MSKILQEVLAANQKYGANFGDKAKLAITGQHGLGRLWRQQFTAGECQTKFGQIARVLIHRTFGAEIFNRDVGFGRNLSRGKLIAFGNRTPRFVGAKLVIIVAKHSGIFQAKWISDFCFENLGEQLSIHSLQYALNH